MNPIIIATRPRYNRKRNSWKFRHTMLVAIGILIAITYWNATIIFSLNININKADQDKVLVKPKGHLIPKSAHYKTN